MYEVALDELSRIAEKVVEMPCLTEWNDRLSSLVPPQNNYLKICVLFL
jgi:hypothetical protein